MKNKIFFRRPFTYKFSRVTLSIIGINILIFAIRFVSEDLFRMIYFYGAMNAQLVEYKHMYWQFFTYMFLHHDTSHIFCNMLGLLVFGLPLEKAIGSREFTLFYLVCGTLSGFFSFLVYKYTGQYNAFLLGASGAIYAVLFAYAVFFPRSVIFIWGIVPVPAPVLVLIYTIIEIGSQFLGSASNVAHMTHLFGFFAAWLYFIIRMGIRPLKVWKKSY